MKTKSGSQIGKSAGASRSCHNKLAAMASIAVVSLALATIITKAEVLDDFEDPAQLDKIWTKTCYFGTCAQVVTNGQARISIKPTEDHGISGIRSVRKWTLEEGRTLEFRADLMSSNGDGAVGMIAFAIGDGARLYMLGVDQDTIFLHKRANPITQLFIITNGIPLKTANVKLVLSMTGVQSSVRLQFQVLDNDQAGAVISEGECWDTPGRDPMQKATDDPPQNYLGLSGYFLLELYHDNAGLFDPNVSLGKTEMAEVVFDNAEVFEYDSPVLDIQKAVCLWSENTAVEQIVVGADSLTSTVWTPWPEPIFKRFGALSMVVDAAAAERYFKLVPGTQFIDDFDSPKAPYAMRMPWEPFFLNAADASRFTFTVSDGVFQIQAHTKPVDGEVAVFTPGGGAIVQDFFASVDILDWASSQESAVGIAGRIQGSPGRLVNAYLGSVRFDPAANTGSIGFFNGQSDVPVPETFNIDPQADYRLQFSAVGRQLDVRLIRLAEPPIIVAEGRLQNSTFKQGYVGHWVNTRGSTGYRRTVDNFFLTGTKP
ncbi:MAG TPA: hypothetical protein P5186_26355 [Candidatus Paceibacterota bacterium]|nr:hypothetical protein [Verrucomicrobiota bacterium]HRY51576.1 hypothetical protein [Candidatus Paceibacterota bacterium]HSA01131.1 hypothetical protein [Candidatus Paceibacterota bacterium]